MTGESLTGSMKRMADVELTLKGPVMGSERVVFTYLVPVG